jgi:hypothetical protein
MGLIVEVVLIGEEERAGEGEFAVVDYSQKVQPVLVKLTLLLLAPVACIPINLHT